MHLKVMALYILCVMKIVRLYWHLFDLEMLQYERSELCGSWWSLDDQWMWRVIRNFRYAKSSAVSNCPQDVRRTCICTDFNTDPFTSLSRHNCNVARYVRKGDNYFLFNCFWCELLPRDPTGLGMLNQLLFIFQLVSILPKYILIANDIWSQTIVHFFFCLF